MEDGVPVDRRGKEALLEEVRDMSPIERRGLFVLWVVSLIVAATAGR